MPTISVIIPAYNEELNIKDTLNALKRLEGIDKIIVVNDGSSDKTAQLATEEGVMVLDLSPNRGKGGAMNAAVPLVDTDMVVFLDADLGETAGQAWKILKPVVDGETDLCIASFPPPLKRGGFGIVKGTAAWLIRKVGKVEMQSPLSGQRAMTREVLNSLSPFHEAYGVELGMTINALLQGFRVMEVPTTMHHKETGRDLKGFLHRGRQFIDILRVIKVELRGKGV
jgi:glycosyltransferase involved in cell wall biosynthesis